MLRAIAEVPLKKLGRIRPRSRSGTSEGVGFSPVGQVTPLSGAGRMGAITFAIRRQVVASITSIGSSISWR
jgi:hypothetical protein